MKKQVYLFSGLGADERVFQKIEFSFCSITNVKWFTPEVDEPIEKYAARLIHQIKSPKPILIGISFGGMIAIEVAKQLETEKVILIASAKVKNEIPFYYRLVGMLRLYKILPVFILKRSNFVTNWFFGVRSTFEKQLLKDILKDTDTIFLKWAIAKITQWNNQTHIDNLYHIHGKSDRILPVAFIQCDQSINNGGHLMTLDQSGILSKIIKEQVG